jgi:hypothetical protein
MTTVPVSFGSDDYFALIAARPEWGRYFALGDHVVVVLAGTAYEIREGEAPPVEVPTGEPTPIPDATPTAEPASDSPDSLIAKVVQAILDLIDQIVEAFSR